MQVACRDVQDCGEMYADLYVQFLADVQVSISANQQISLFLISLCIK